MPRLLVRTKSGLQSRTGNVRTLYEYGRMLKRSGSVTVPLGIYVNNKIFWRF